jgi:hypothetical protein
MMNLIVKYPPSYPDVIPELKLEPIDEGSGELTEEESEMVLEKLRMLVCGFVMLDSA